MSRGATRAGGGIPHYKAVVIGGSAGGVEALATILPALPGDFVLPVLVVQHLHASDDGAFSFHLANLTQLPVAEPCDKTKVEPGRVYTAPANYHMLVERDGTIALSVEGRVNWSRPSIDVLFESAAQAWGEALIAVILSGANTDGARGILAVHAAGGLTIVQDPAEAGSVVMPQAAIATGAVAHVLPAGEIGRLLADLGGRKTNLPPGYRHSIRQSTA
ncbi:MAG: chemotaxis protein CheB [Deltaproteobacteria bacterium]|nr:chemotaxis protein CheB [Candidatus Anaeroferrophillacea bacterium]